MTGPENYKSANEAKKLAEQIRVKVEFMVRMLHDIDPDQLDKFLKLLRKACNIKFLRAK